MQNILQSVPGPGKYDVKGEFDKKRLEPSFFSDIEHPPFGTQARVGHPPFGTQARVGHPPFVTLARVGHPPFGTQARVGHAPFETQVWVSRSSTIKLNVIGSQ